MTHEELLDGFDDIIAIRFNDKIMFGQPAIDRLKSDGSYDQLLSRAEFRLFTRMDLGEKWGKYAEIAPTLFKLPRDVDIDVRQPMMSSHTRF